MSSTICVVRGSVATDHAEREEELSLTRPVNARRRSMRRKSYASMSLPKLKSRKPQGYSSAAHSNTCTTRSAMNAVETGDFWVIVQEAGQEVERDASGLGNREW